MADIVIGARRPSQHRPLRSAAIALTLLLVCALVAYVLFDRIVSYATPDAAVPDRPLRANPEASAPGLVSPYHLDFGASSLTFSGSITVLRTRGDPRELGAAHGRLLGPGIQAPLRALASNIDRAIPSDGFIGGSLYGIRRRWRYRLLDDGIPGHQLVEIASMVAGAERSAAAALDYEWVVRTQAALDVGAAAPWSSAAEFRAVARSLSFVSDLRGQSGDRLIVGRSFALPGAGDGGDAAAAGLTVSFVRADSVIPFASIGWPGLVGVVSGINAEGIAVMVHPTRTRVIAVTRKAQPMALLARDILENARTLNDAIAMIEHAELLGAAGFVIADGKARAWAVVERDPTRVAVQRNPRPCVVGDVLGAQAFADDIDNDRAGRVRPSLMRTRRTAARLRGNKESMDEFSDVLRDRLAPGGAPLPPGHRGAIYDPSAVHAAIFDVSGMVLWVAEHGDAEGRFRSFDLRHELRREGSRPAAPADLTRAGDREPTTAWRVRQARKHLRAARRLWRDDEPEAAAEHIERALAYAPDLPEALQLAGDLARSLGDRQRASEHYRRYLELGPDDLGAEQKIRAMMEN